MSGRKKLLIPILGMTKQDVGDSTDLCKQVCTVLLWLSWWIMWVAVCINMIVMINLYGVLVVRVHCMMSVHGSCSRHSTKSSCQTCELV